MKTPQLQSVCYEFTGEYAEANDRVHFSYYTDGSLFRVHVNGYQVHDGKESLRPSVSLAKKFLQLYLEK